MDEQKKATTDTEKKRLTLFSAGILLAIGIVLACVVALAAWGLCSTTPVPPAGVAVPAGAIAVTGTPPATGGGPIPPGAMCTGGTGDTSNAPGASCWVFGNCTDTYHMQTGKCECRCD